MFKTQSPMRFRPRKAAESGRQNISRSNKFTKEAIEHRAAATLRVAAWIASFDAMRNEQLAQWIEIEGQRKEARHAAEEACFWARVGRHCNPDKEDA